MPRHLISDVHEWINEVAIVPTDTLAKPQPRERARQKWKGQEDPIELDFNEKPMTKIGDVVVGGEAAMSDLSSPTFHLHPFQVDVVLG